MKDGPDRFDKKTASKRTEAALRAALTNAPKPREDMKIQKAKASPKKKSRG